nr:hypothetical protein CoNPh38_CDS0290 [Staphylococcus phage S-CoN_Ph38]
MEFHDLDYFNDKANELYERDSKEENKNNRVTINYGNYDLVFYFRESDGKLILKYNDFELGIGSKIGTYEPKRISKMLYDYQFYPKDHFESLVSKKQIKNVLINYMILLWNNALILLIYLMTYNVMFSYITPYMVIVN